MGGCDSRQPRNLVSSGSRVIRSERVENSDLILRVFRVSRRSRILSCQSDRQTPPCRRTSAAPWLASTSAEEWNPWSPSARWRGFCRELQPGMNPNQGRVTDDESHGGDAVYGRESRCTVIHWGYVWGGYFFDSNFQIIHLLCTSKLILSRSATDKFTRPLAELPRDSQLFWDTHGEALQFWHLAETSRYDLISTKVLFQQLRPEPRHAVYIYQAAYVRDGARCEASDQIENKSRNRVRR